MFRNYYSGRRVLVTGHTGFKGGWLSLWLRQLGAEVHGFSLPAPTQPGFHEVIRGHAFAGQVEGDLRDLEAVRQAVATVRPEMVFHLAAQPLVRLSYAEPLPTLATNVLGTAHLLEAVRAAGLPGNVVVITSDKCYENREWEHAYRENDAMGGHDIYSMSKGASELVAQAWQRSFFAPNPALGSVVTVRAGNVIGGGDYAADRLVPDCFRALIAGQPIQIRNPAALRPWQHVLECLSGYLWLGACLHGVPKDSPLVSPFNFGPGPAARQTVRELVEEILRHWPGQWVDGSRPNQPHEAKLLSLAIDKAAALLGWHPVWDFPTTIAQTVAWYHHRHTSAQPDMLQRSLEQIAAYTQAAATKGVAWTA
jgi:CDP-glucose 4,6-dehydratase